MCEREKEGGGNLVCPIVKLYQDKEGLLLLHLCLKSVTHCFLWTCQSDWMQNLIYTDNFSCCSAKQNKWHYETSSQGYKQTSLSRNKVEHCVKYWRWGNHTWKNGSQVLQVHLKTRMKAQVDFNSSVLAFCRADYTSLSISLMTVKRQWFIGNVTTEIRLQE